MYVQAMADAVAGSVQQEPLSICLGVRNEFVRKLQERGDVLVVDREVDPAHELAAVTQLAQKKGKPVIFNNVKGTRFPVVTNVYSTRERLGEVIGIDAADFCRQWSKLASLGSSEMKEPLSARPKLRI